MTAENWYKKTLAILAIKEKQGNEHGAASTYHQLGTMARNKQDFVFAEGWYKKALAIFEKQGDAHGTASTYHHLGIMAQVQQDFMTAEDWYKKALAIFEKQGDAHDAASTYHQLGRVAEEQRDFHQAGDFYLKSAKIFADTDDAYNLMIVVRSYACLLHTTAGTERRELRQAWSTCLSQELTKILEEVEVELDYADS